MGNIIWLRSNSETQISRKSLLDLLNEFRSGIQIPLQYQTIQQQYTFWSSEYKKRLVFENTQSINQIGKKFCTFINPFFKNYFNSQRMKVSKFPKVKYTTVTITKLTETTVPTKKTAQV